MNERPVNERAVSNREGHPLPCGRLVEDVYDDLEAGRPGPHPGCEHCTTARRSLEKLAEATRQIFADPAVPPPGLLERVMTAVRAEVRRGDVLPLPAELGPADVSEQAVAVVLRYVADTVTGVRARSCRVEIDPDRAHTVRIRMTLALRYRSAAELLAEVRRRVTAAMSGQIGLDTAAVDLELVDVWDEEVQ